MKLLRAKEIAAEFATAKTYTVQALGSTDGAYLLITEAKGRTSAFAKEDNFWRSMPEIAAACCPIPGEHHPV